MNNPSLISESPPNDEIPLVLIVDDDKGSRMAHEMLLKRLASTQQIQIRIESSTDVPTALQILGKTRAHVILLDKDLSKDKTDPNHNGIEAIPQLLQLQPHLQILVITGSKSTDDAVRAIQLGALGYVTKESGSELISSQIRRAMEIAQTTITKNRSDRLRVSNPMATALGGKSRAFQQLLANAQLLAESSRPVLILGETGTGKTEVARYIHRCRTAHLKQPDRDLIAVNVAALPSDMIERELFGHEKGSFTDATESRVGYFELAGNSGTLFLDEIGEASLALQAKLLTVLETGEFFRLGGTKKIVARPKVILATNRNLEEMVRNRKFREDLFMRIASFTLHMPSLADRKEDIPDIIRALLPKCARAHNMTVDFNDIPNDFIEHLSNTKLDGNIRAIEHQLERLLVFSPKDQNKKPTFKHWRSIPGLYLKEEPSIATESSRETKNAITLRDLLNKPLDVLLPQFPGILAFQRMMQEKIFDESDRKHLSNAELSGILKVSPSYTWRLRKGLLRGERFPTAPRNKKKRGHGK